MTICVNCGKESEMCLCQDCKQTVDVEKLCKQIIEYKPLSEENIIWDSIAKQMYSPNNFKNIVFAIANELQTPKKEYLKILSVADSSGEIPKQSRKWLYEMYENCKDNVGLSIFELNHLRGLVLDALFKDYMYAEADEIATEIMEADELPKKVYMIIADFYTKTRRYDEAEEILSDAKQLFSDDKYALSEIGKLMQDNDKRRGKGKTEYMPNPKENKEEIRKKYVEFLATLGIEAEVPISGIKSGNAPKPIPKDQYPKPIEIRDTNFNTFVAFDLETTGKSSKIDSIIEIGAVKVVDGQVVEEKEFVFQEFVKPYKRKLSERVQKLTGITVDDVKDAREMWEVTPDFLKFVGDNILVGFNCIAFDSKFMIRAGRYSNVIIENRYFDVMRYAEQFKTELGIEDKKCSLEQLTKKLDVINPRAHRALADAITTAKVYLKLKEMDKGEVENMVDDLLADIDDW